jgi:copper chaperone
LIEAFTTAFAAGMHIQASRPWAACIQTTEGCSKAGKSEETQMDKQTFRIPKISCGHCTRTIENELKELEGVNTVQSSIDEKTVTVEYGPPATKETILATLKEINYPAD